MGITAIHNALTGLRAHQRALAVISNNIVNANDEGYTKKIVQLESLNFGKGSGGVQLADIARNVDEYLMRDRRESMGDYEAVKEMNRFLKTVEGLFGKLSDTESLGNKVNSFGETLDRLATTPEDVFNARKMINKATDVVDKLNEISRTLQNLRVEADQEIEKDVGEINIILDEIDDLNVRIVRYSRVDPKSGVDEDLRDKRDVLLNKASKLLDISYFYNSDGAVTINTSAGRPLLNVDPVKVHHESATRLSHGIQHDPDENRDTSLNGRIGGLYTGGGRSARDDFTTELRRGSVKGLVDIRDTLLPNLQDQINKLARSLQQEVNRVHNLNTAYPPVTNLEGTKRFHIYNRITDSFDNTAPNVGANIVGGTGVVRLSVVARAPRVAAGTINQTMTIDLDRLRQNNGGLLSLDNLITEINRNLGDDGQNFAATASIGEKGNLHITADNPAIQGIMIDQPTNLYRSRSLTTGTPGQINTFLDTNLPSTGQFQIRDANTDAQIGVVSAGTQTTALISNAVIPAIQPLETVVPGAPSTLTITRGANTQTINVTAGMTYRQLTNQINALDGISANAVRNPAGGPNPGLLTLNIVSDSGAALTLGGTIFAGGGAFPAAIPAATLAPITWRQLADRIDGIDGLTASFVRDSGLLAARNDDNLYLQVTDDQGRRLAFVDAMGTVSVAAEVGLAGSRTNILAAAAPLGTATVVPAAAVGSFQVVDNGRVLGTVTVNAGDDYTSVLGTLNGFAGVSASFNQPVGGDLTLYVVGANGQRLNFVNTVNTPTQGLGLADAADSNELTGLRKAGSMVSAQSKSFPEANVPIARFDRELTASTPNLTLSITLPNGGVINMPNFDATTSSLSDIATAINGMTSTNNMRTIMLGARIIEDDGRKIEIFVQSSTGGISAAANRADLGGSISFAGTGATMLGLTQSSETNIPHYFGLNDFFVDEESFNLAQNMKVRSDIQNDETLLSRVRAKNGIAATLKGVARGDTVGARGLANVFQSHFNYSQIGDGTDRFTLAGLNATLSEYATRIVANTGLEISKIDDQMEFRQNVVEELDSRIEGISGVNMDEELSDMILYQNAYKASARVVTVSQEILDEIIGLIR